MAGSAYRDQILRAVMPKLASPLDVMNLQMFRCAAILATPIVPGKNLLAKRFVRLPIQSLPRLFWPQARHSEPLNLVPELVLLLQRQ